jgi:hypothetical protein
MKKSLSLLFILLLIIPIFSFIIQAETPPDPSLTIGNVVGINPENIPSSPEDIQNQYLEKEWGKIMENSTFYGPFHRTFIANPLPFNILFSTPYSFTLTFFLIIFIWLIIAFTVKDSLNASKLIPGIAKFPLSAIVGIAVSTILAQTKLYYLISITFISIIFSPSSWWARLIIAATIFIVMMFALYFEKGLMSQIRIWKKKKEDSNVNQSKKILNKTANSIIESKKEEQD